MITKIKSPAKPVCKFLSELGTLVIGEFFISEAQDFLIMIIPGSQILCWSIPRNDYSPAVTTIAGLGNRYRRCNVELEVI